MSDLTYDELVRELFPRLTGGIRWGLDRTIALLAEAGNPHHSFRSIHVGGTNGKGSVAATLASITRADGRNTGLYTSPHLCTFRERIQINGTAITEAALVAAARKLWPAIQRMAPSFFEATTAIGFLALAEAGVDIAVVEVGLGGRLDSTNVIQPDLVVITNIDLDHAEYLGNSIESVAREKAGIIKSAVPVLTAERSEVALTIFRERASEVGATLHVMPPDDPHDVVFGLEGTALETWGNARRKLRLHTPLIGRHQARNVALAVHAASMLPADLRPSQDAIVQGTQTVAWPGRLQVEQIGEQTWLFDVAHNNAGIHALVEAVSGLQLPRPLVIVVGILGDKDWKAMLPPLFAVADAVVLTLPPTAPAGRVWDPAQVLREVPSERAEAQADFHAALLRAAEVAGRGTVLVTGSFHTVGDALIALDRAPFGSDVTLPRVRFSG